MVIATLKDIAEIIQYLNPYERILVIGCAGCTAISLTGGQREVDSLITLLRKEFKHSGDGKKLAGYTMERQCDANFISELDAFSGGYDAFLSMACGAGVQLVAERVETTPVFPALNTQFVGIHRNVGWFEENCRACSDCVLAYTGGICPVTRCAKSIFHGPCGGPRHGRCEVHVDIPCAWVEIYKRLKSQNRLDDIIKIRPPMKWKNQTLGTAVLEEFKDRYE
jgi:hypothetical protein